MSNLNGIREWTKWTRRLVLIVALMAVVESSARSSSIEPVPPVMFTIVNVDPDPVLVGQLFTVVIQTSNQSNKSTNVVFTCKSDISLTPENVTLNPQETRTLELQGKFLAAGVKSIIVSSSWQTDKTILVPVGPTRVERRPVFEALPKSYANVNVLAAKPPTPTFVDIGPDSPSSDDASAGGVVGAIEGSRDILFAVTKTAGIWRSVNQGPWQQLPQSPPRAFSLAVDPGNASHLLAGEREDDVKDSSLGRSGLWESTDNGNTWSKIYDPLSDTNSQAIPSIAIAQGTSTTVFATNNGVGRLPRKTGADYPVISYARQNPNDWKCRSRPDFGPISAVTVSTHRIWARSTSELFFSDDDGQTFSCRTLPQPVAVPGGIDVQANYDYSSNGGNDKLSLAAFDDRAYIIFNTVVSSSDPRAIQDPACNPNHPDYNASQMQCTLNSLLLTFVISGSNESWVAQITRDRDGTGLNGRRFVKVVELSSRTCQLPARTGFGYTRHLIYGAGQGLQQAAIEGVDNRIVFDAPVYSNAGGPPPPGKLAPMHSDLWDILLPRDYCPSTRPDIFVANDGGVYRGTNVLGARNRLFDLTWTQQNEGLRAHTAQNLLAIDTGMVPPPRPGQPFLPLLKLAYPTQDNEGWWRDEKGTWSSTSGLGDANFVVGDIGGTSMIIWRQLTTGCPKSTGCARFIDASGSSKSITLNLNQPFDGPTSIQAIQTLASEARTWPSLDMVMLVQLPLTNTDGTVVSGALGSGSKRFALIRNKHFEANPDGPAAGFAGWEIVSDSLPQGTSRFWVAGGHASPKYYVYTDGSNSTCQNGLFSRKLEIVPRGQSAWKCLISDLPDSAKNGDLYGPAFVNPFNPNMIFVAAGDSVATSSIQISTDGGSHFCKLPALKSLVTDSDRFNLVDSFNPGASFNPLGSRFHGDSFNVPEQIVFDRYAPSRMLVASPYTGLFYGVSATASTGSLSCTDPSWSEPSWFNLSPHLPKPAPYISDIALVNSSAIVATRGRGTFALSNIKAAQPATYFVTERIISQGNPVATLRRSEKAVVPWGRVIVTALAGSSRSRVINQIEVRSDADGHVRLPSPLPAGSYVIELSFVGNGNLAPATTAFALSVQ